MQRREFIATVVALSAVSACQSVPTRADSTTAFDLPQVGEALNTQFNALLAWLAKDTPWRVYLTTTLGISLPASLDDAAGKILLRGYSPDELKRIRSTPGFEDFGGSRLIEPAKPALSLLYFALASPRVRLPAGATDEHYPTIAQLEVLENYIYAAQPIGNLDLTGSGYVLAVFAYEFRPGAKTPHGKHADLVFSRTGISRVGTLGHHWNRTHRRFDNMPSASAGQPASAQDAAVTPARFGLFLAQMTGHKNGQVIGKTDGDWRQKFLLPIRKLVTGDPLLAGRAVVFSQYHRDEKLARLLTMRAFQGDALTLPAGVPFERNQPPFLRVTCTSTASEPLPSNKDNTSGTDQQLVSLIQLGSSVLLEPYPAPMVREAFQQLGGTRERLRFRVPAFATHTRPELNNRRYTTLKLIENPVKEAFAFYSDDILYGGLRKTTTFIAPRNGPTFVNIRYKVSEHDGNTVTHLGPGCGIDNWEKTIHSGDYWAALFQDNLCDGCVSASLSPAGTTVGTGIQVLDELLKRPILPAFSLVSAPDFMQLVDGIDMGKYDNHFLEGGTETVSGARVRANPHLLLPGSDRPAFPLSFNKAEGIAYDTAYTVTAVVSDAPVAKQLRVQRDYQSTNSLPDTASNVFAPGWDVTYSDVGAGKNFYFASFGLGSPFPEDMKLCAAANGMWPASSPDAARTFYPSLAEVVTSTFVPKKWSRRPPTAVPLLDVELGLHEHSAAVRQYTQSPMPGWDGEYGPFLVVKENTARTERKLAVNFTDIGRADYVKNVFSPANKMRIGALQNIGSDELIGRMGALQKCIRKLPNTSFQAHHVRLSKLWLVSAESVPDWSSGAPGFGIPRNLFGNDNGWATASRLGPDAGAGLLFVFAVQTADDIEPVGPDSTRSVADCKALYVCQLARQGRDPDKWALAWTAVKDIHGNAPGEKDWNVHR